MDGFYPDRAKKTAMQHRRVLERLRREWYGKNRGVLENGAHDPVLRIAELAAETLRDSCPDGETRDFAELNARFDLVAQEWCGMVRPYALHDGVLTLKLRHRAYRERVEEDLELILDSVNSAFCRSICRAIVLC